MRTVPLFFFLATLLATNLFAQLDPDFGEGGVVITSDEPSYLNAHAIAVHPDGRILTAGSALSNGESNVLVVAYTFGGLPDSDFGNTGFLSIDLNEGYEEASCIAIQPDGKILIGASSGKNLYLIRLTPEGYMDPDFGEMGIVTTQVNDKYSEGWGGIHIFPDGKILMSASLGYENVLIKYCANGDLEKSFGIEGIVIVDLGDVHDETQRAAMAVQADGKIIVSGFCYVESYDFSLKRFLPNGSLDTSFGSNGNTIIDINELSDDRITCMKLQDDGKILIAGWSGMFHNQYSSWNYGLTRLNKDGSLDDTFNSDGKIITDLDNFKDDRPEGIEILEDNKILLIGYTYSHSQSKSSMVSYEPDGTPDASLGNNGILIIDQSPPYVSATVMQEPHKVLAVGNDFGSITLMRVIIGSPSVLNQKLSTDNKFEAFPNPLSENALAKYFLPESGLTTITLYDQNGKIIQSILSNQFRQQGENTESISLNASIPAGNYILELRCNEYHISSQLVVE